MKFEHIRPYGPDAYSYYVSGIYKIVTYRPGEYHAYFIPENYRRWGEHVARPADKIPCRGCGSAHCPGWHVAYRTRRRAERACRVHAREYTPSKATQARALDTIAVYRELAARYKERAA